MPKDISKCGLTIEQCAISASLLIRNTLYVILVFAQKPHTMSLLECIACCLKPNAVFVVV